MGSVDSKWQEWAISNAERLPEHQREEYIAIIRRGNQVECANANLRYFGDQGIEMSDHPSVKPWRKLAEKQRQGDADVCAPNQPAGGFTFPALVYHHPII